MGALAWVEVLDRRDHVRARHRIDAMPALIGRGYGCDVIVDDPWISPIHARIYRDLDGTLKVEDAGSENGIWTIALQRITFLPVGIGITLRLGRSTLRIVPADASVAPALPAHAEAPAATGWDLPWVGALAAVVAGATFGLTQLLGESGTHHDAEVLGDALALIAGMACWAGIWALATRTVWQRGRFAAHFAVVAVAALVMMGMAQGLEYAAFLAPGIPGFEGAFVMLLVGAAAAMLYGHLVIATALSKLRIAAISTAVVFGVVGVGTLATSADDEAAAMPQFGAELKPLNAALIPVEDTTAFFGSIGELRATVDSLVHEKP